MSLDPMPDTATLMRLKQERESRGRARAESWPSLPPSASPEARPAPQPSAGALTLTLPWSALQTGNRFFGLTSKAYRDAKEKAEGLILEQTGGAPRFLGGRPVRLGVVLYMPNNQRRDLLNYAKLICDALSGLAFSDDSQIHEARFTRMVDVDRPRAEVTVEGA